LEFSTAGNHYLKHGGLVEVIADLASDNEPLLTDIADKLDQALTEFGDKFVAETFDPFAEMGWPSQKDEEETLWKPLTKKLMAGPRNVAEIDEIKSSFLEESRATNQKVVVQDFNRLERRLIGLHIALQGAMRNSDNLPADLKRRMVMLTLKSYLRILQVGLVLAPAISKQRSFRWHGINFLNNLNDQETDQSKRAQKVMVCLIPAISERMAQEIGSRKLGEVFKLLAKSADVTGFLRLLTFVCLIRSKPRGWMAQASDVIATTDRNAFYLHSMLALADNQFHDEVNTTAEREELKRLIAVIRMRRELKKINPGEKDIQQVVDRMDQQHLFETK